MDSTKTGIWREGLAGLLRDALAKAPSSTATPNPESGGRRSTTPPPPPPPSRVRTMPLHIPVASELQPTRVWPIERLLANLPPAAATGPLPLTPPPLAAPLQPPPSTPAPAPQRPRPVSRRNVRIAAYVVTAGIVRAVLGLVQPTQEAAGARQALWPQPLARSHAAQRAPVEIPAPAPDLQPQPAPLSGQALPAETPVLGPAQLAQLERSAVDALIAGDHATARERYAELARARPSERAFTVAANVLEAREREAAQP